MRKELKRIGSSIGFTFNKEEQKAYCLKLGDIIEISPKKIKENRKMPLNSKKSRPNTQTHPFPLKRFSLKPNVPPVA